MNQSEKEKRSQKLREAIRENEGDLLVIETKILALQSMKKKLNIALERQYEKLGFLEAGNE